MPPVRQRHAETRLGPDHAADNNVLFPIAAHNVSAIFET